MFKEIAARWRQGFRTHPYPKKLPALPERFRGLPVLGGKPCPGDCRACLEVCPTQALILKNQHVAVDLGKCLFCGECARVCPAGAIRFSTDHRLAVRRRGDLNFTGGELKLAEALDQQSRRVFGRSLQLRQVSAGGCNACEADVNVLNTLFFDLGRFGVQFTASPRHADGLLITGPVTKHMHEALMKTYAAVPAPKFVIAVGACAINGGPYIGHAETHEGATNVLPVDLFIPGCPPHPLTILDGILRLLGRMK